MGKFNDLAAGAVGGTFGGLAMFGVRVVGTQTGIIMHSLPDKFERGTAEKTGFARDQDPEQQKELAIAEHIVLSAGFGAAYGLLRRWIKPPAILGGVVYGLVVYTMMLMGIGPALGIVRMPQDKPHSSVLSEVFVHLLFGTVTATVVDRLRS